MVKEISDCYEDAQYASKDHLFIVQIFFWNGLTNFNYARTNDSESTYNQVFDAPSHGSILKIEHKFQL